MSSSFLTEHPRRALLFALVVVTLVVGGRIAIGMAANQPTRNDQATLNQLRSQFAHTAWEPHLIGAYWDSSGDLKVGFDRDDRKLALQACSDLTDIVQEQASMGPDGVLYTTTENDRSIFIFDRADELLVTNFPNLNTGCQWRPK